MGVSQTILHEEVESRYLAYALSTIVSRALPDVRDGLKPVHRRIIYAMETIGARQAARHVKSARVVGEVIGKYHPHGDAAVYDAMVRMAQDFSLRYPLVDGQGNFGSLDGDSAAAMRYTEAKLTAIAGELLADLKAQTVAFRDNYDGTLTEPAVLPSRIPNLLANGSSGIAVGMATNIPPHNLSEVCDALIHLIGNEDADTAEIMARIKGPDFPTGGQIISSTKELNEIYRRGKGSIKVRGEFKVENLQRGKKQLVISSLPYSVNKSRLVERIAELILSKKLPMVNNVKDESSESVRVVLELKDGKVDPEKVKTFLFKHTDMEINFPLNFTCLTPSATPERLSIKEILNHFLDFRKEVIVGKLEFEKASLERRIHILLGFMKIFVDLDAAIAIIRVALDRQEAHDNLKARFDLDDEQAKAILDLRLHALVRMEVSKIEEELTGKQKRLKQIKSILTSRARVWKEVRKEITELKKSYGDKRLTAVIADGSELTYDKEDFVIHEDVYVVISRNGWLKRVKSYDPSTQMLKEGDEVLTVIRSNTRETVAFFSNFGKVYVSRVYDLDVSGKGYGDPIQTVFNFQDEEKIIDALAAEPEPGRVLDMSFMVQPDPGGGQVEPGQLTFFPDLDKDAEPNKRVSQEAPPPLCLVLTRQGMGFCFERGSLKDTSSRAGRTLIRLRPDDEVVGVRPVERPLLAIATSRRILVTPMVQVNVLAGAGRGVRLIKPDPPGVRDFFTVDQDDSLIIRNKKGKEKETVVVELPIYNRGAKGAVIKGGIEDVQLKLRGEELAALEDHGDSEQSEEESLD